MWQAPSCIRLQLSVRFYDFSPKVQKPRHISSPLLRQRVASKDQWNKTLLTLRVFTSQVDDLRFFVLDEADRMVEKGHFKELQSIIDTLPKQGGAQSADSDPPEEDTIQEAVPLKHAAQRQTFVFSATLMVPPSLKKKLKGAGKAPMRREQGQVAALIERAGTHILFPPLVRTYWSSMLRFFNVSFLRWFAVFAFVLFLTVRYEVVAVVRDNTDLSNPLAVFETRSRLDRRVRCLPDLQTVPLYS